MSQRLAVPLTIPLTLLGGCGHSAGPQEAALAYGRALHANDGDAIWNLASASDQRAKDRATFRQQQQIVEWLRPGPPRPAWRVRDRHARGDGRRR